MTPHLLIIIHDMLLDLGGVHPRDKVLHISVKQVTEIAQIYVYHCLITISEFFFLNPM